MNDALWDAIREGVAAINETTVVTPGADPDVSLCLSDLKALVDAAREWAKFQDSERLIQSLDRYDKLVRSLAQEVVGI